MTDPRRRLAGKSILVTAAAAGIGRASVERLAAEGAKVVATDINEAELESLAVTPGVMTCRLDVTDGKAIETLAARLGPLDGLFNCVGIVPGGTILDCDDAQWERTFAVNATACFRMIRAVLPAMVGQGRGAIVNMASIVSSLKGAPNRFAYAASKAAILGITKSVAVDFVDSGIRCNAVCPGTVDTPSLAQRLAETGDYASARRAFEARQPMGRLAQPTEIASMVAFLMSDDASFITGQAYAVDGGWSN